MTLSEIKDVEYNILLEFSDICERNKLRYSLAYGTLLGAIRHSGFIPWDDDIDVMMLREDYERLIAICDTALDKTVYRLASMHNQTDYFAPLTKMYDNRTLAIQEYGQIEGSPIGVGIDIFVIDRLPNINQEAFYKAAEKMRWKWGLASRKLFSTNSSSSIFRWVGGFLYSIPLKIRGAKYYRNKYDSFCSQYSRTNSDDIAVIVYGEGFQKEKMKMSDFLNRSKVLFERDSFYAINSPDKYLKQMYGNYMVFPPIEQRVPKHPVKCFWLDD